MGKRGGGVTGVLKTMKWSKSVPGVGPEMRVPAAMKGALHLRLSLNLVNKVILDLI